MSNRPGRAIRRRQNACPVTLHYSAAGGDFPAPRRALPLCPATVYILHTMPTTTSSNARLRIWCNMSFPPPATQLLRDGTSQHELLFASSMTASNLSTAAPDPQLPTADIVFGQPDPDTIKTASRVRWTHLTSAGYERYDRADLREAMKARGSALTNSSL